MRAERGVDGGGNGREQAPRGTRGERWLDLVFQQVPGAAWATDRDLRLLWVLGRIPGVRDAAGAFVGRTVFDYVDTTDETHPAIAGHRAALAGESARFRYERDGHCYEVLIEPLDAGDEGIIGTVGAAVDVTARQRAEARLAESEARLREAQALAHVGSWQWDIERDRVTCSDEMFRILGLSPERFAGTFDALLAALHPEDRARTEQASLTAIRTKEPFDYVQRVMRPDGSVRYLRSRGAAVFDDGGHAVRLVGSGWDVTEQREAERRLEQSVSLLTATLNATWDGILVVDRDGRVTATNERFLELWRLPRRLVELGDDEQLLSAVLEQLLDPEGFQRRVRELYAAPADESLDEVRFRDGRVFERYSRPQRVGDEIIGRVWSFRDVTERVSLLGRLTFLSDASRLLATLDVKEALRSIGSLALANVAEACAVDLFEQDGPQRLLTMCRAEEPPELAMACAAPPARPQLYEGSGRAWMSVPVLSQQHLLAALRVVAPAGRPYRQNDLDTFIELGARVALALENARVHEDACDALRARDEVLAIAAHEIRGPLTSMRLSIQTLKQKPVAREESQVFSLLERETRRLARFVDELLDAVRVRGGLLTLRLEEVDLGEVIHEVAARMGEEVKRSGSKLTVVVDEPVVGVWDRDRVEQAVSNLLSNALKYGLGRPITLSLERHDDEALVSVTDQGMGIQPERQSHLFQPFERGVSSRHYGGLGLGLYLVRSIAESLAGRVDVESEVGKGSTFRLRLPLARGTG